MEAVANPSRTRDLFFVADGTGGHAFAETLDQHNRNVTRWRQIEGSRREAGRPSPEASVDKVEPAPAVPAPGPVPVAPERRTDATDPAGGARAVGFTDTTQPADLETFPVPAGRRAGWNQPAPAPGRAAAPQPVQGSQPGQARSRAFDASEGTARDPLLNRNFDLNSPKAIPALRP